MQCFLCHFERLRWRGLFSWWFYPVSLLFNVCRWSLMYSKQQIPCPGWPGCALSFSVRFKCLRLGFMYWINCCLCKAIVVSRWVSEMLHQEEVSLLLKTNFYLKGGRYVVWWDSVTVHVQHVFVSYGQCAKYIEEFQLGRLQTQPGCTAEETLEVPSCLDDV